MVVSVNLVLQQQHLVFETQFGANSSNRVKVRHKSHNKTLSITYHKGGVSFVVMAPTTAEVLSKQKATAKLYSKVGNRSSKLMAALLQIIMLMVLQMKSVSGLRCYTCTYLQEYADNTCLVDANSTRITNCSKKYCTIMRQESVRPSGKVISFIRDCLDKPLYLNAVKADSTFKTFYRSCTTDLCNDSDGTTSATNTDPNLGASENMIIKGKRH